MGARSIQPKSCIQAPSGRDIQASGPELTRKQAVPKQFIVIVTLASLVSFFLCASSTHDRSNNITLQDSRKARRGQHGHGLQSRRYETGSESWGHVNIESLH